MRAAAFPHHPGLIALQAPVKLGATGEMPTRLVMMKWGENETAQGPMTVGLRTLQASKLWDGVGYGDVVIDFNHNTVPGHPSYQGEPAKVAAHATPRVIEGEGLVFENIRWTPEGIANREHYPDLSPAIKLDESGEVIFCHSAALARNGAVKDLHLFSAEAIPAPLAEKLKTLSAEPTKTTTMIDLAALKKLLKLPDDATEEDINKAIAELMKTGEAKPDAAEVTALTATLTKVMKAIADELRGQITTLNARIDGQERAAIVDAATAAGKVVPKEWLPDDTGQGGLPNDQLRTLCATLPEIVPLERRTPSKIVTLNAGANVITDADRAVMKQLGFSEEQWKKAGAA